MWFHTSSCLNVVILVTTPPMFCFVKKKKRKKKNVKEEDEKKKVKNETSSCSKSFAEHCSIHYLLDHSPVLRLLHFHA